MKLEDVPTPITDREWISGYDEQQVVFRSICENMEQKLGLAVAALQTIQQIANDTNVYNVARETLAQIEKPCSAYFNIQNCGGDLWIKVNSYDMTDPATLVVLFIAAGVATLIRWMLK